MALLLPWASQCVGRRSTTLRHQQLRLHLRQVNRSRRGLSAPLGGCMISWNTVVMQPQAKSTAQIYDAQLRVRYAETDQMGVVYHSNYIVWFEVGRVELLRQLGFTYRDMEQQDDTHIAVADVHCRFKSPARYDDLITVRTWLVNVRESLLHFGYEIVRAADGKVLAEGDSVHIVVDSAFKRMHLPGKYMGPLLEAAGRS